MSFLTDTSYAQREGTKKIYTYAKDSDPMTKVAPAHDQLATGRRFRVLNVVDDVTRECLAAVVDTSISSRRVVHALRQDRAVISPRSSCGCFGDFVRESV
jgi:transposase InsO family protein